MENDSTAMSALCEALHASGHPFPRTAVMECAPRGSLRLDARGLDPLGPLLGFVGNELAEVGGRADKRCASQVGKLRLDFGIDKARVDHRVELVDDLGRRVLWCADTEPETRFVARHKLSHGRDVRQRVRARRGGYSRGPQL